MKFEFELNKEDLYSFYTFFKKSSNLIGDSKFRRFSLSSVSILLALYHLYLFFSYDGWNSWGLLLSVSIFGSMFFNVFSVKDTSLLKNIEKNHKDIIGSNVQIYKDEKYIIQIDCMGTCSYNYSSIKSISESSEYYFIKLLISTTLILPKKRLDEIYLKQFIREIVDDYGVEFTQDLEWEAKL